MSSIEKEPWFLDICQEFDEFCGKIETLHEKGVARDNNEKQKILIQEREINNEQKQLLDKATLRYEEITHVCAVLKSNLKISDNDLHRLDNAKASFKLAKELTGILFDFSVPPNICKGFIKNKPSKLLYPFEMEANSNALWKTIMATANPIWSDKDTCGHYIKKETLETSMNKLRI